jgi:hypothetical protein
LAWGSRNPDQIDKNNPLALGELLVILSKNKQNHHRQILANGQIPLKPGVERVLLEAKLRAFAKSWLPAVGAIQ